MRCQATDEADGAVCGSAQKSGSHDEIQCDHDGTTTDCWQGQLDVRAR